jgi:hypothetical protein
MHYSEISVGDELYYLTRKWNVGYVAKKVKVIRNFAITDVVCLDDPKQEDFHADCNNLFLTEADAIKDALERIRKQVVSLLEEEVRLTAAVQKQIIDAVREEDRLKEILK